MKTNKKYIEVKTTYGVNDCHECCFALQCINACRIPNGYHWEENK